jgi:predicted enzyme related to lactoylglutathione lyase
MNGTIVWHDITVPDADGLRDFYTGVMGWTVHNVDMPGYQDYAMMAGDTPVAGVCHARGSNANMPPQWLIYVQVADVAATCKEAIRRGGDVIEGPRDMGGKSFAVIKDPAGAVIGVYQE